MAVATATSSTVDIPSKREYVRREYDYWWRQYKRRWRGTIVVSVANPILFLIAIGAGIGRLVTPSTDSPVATALGGVTYLAFFAPGMLAAASMQNGIIEGLQAVRGRMPDGPYQPAITSPLEPSDILLGHVLYMVVRIAMSAAAFLVVMVAMGAAHSGLVVLAWWPARQPVSAPPRARSRRRRGCTGSVTPPAG